MTNFEFIRSLKNVKLVLGNGFDLHCKLHSSYKNYHQKYKQKYDYLIKMIRQYLEESENGYAFFENATLDKEMVAKFNLWDYFFALARMLKIETIDYDWCDIEALMQDSLLGRNDVFLSWPKVFTIYSTKDSVQENSPNEDFIAGIIFCMRDGKDFIDKDEFYEFIFNELRKFEFVFGRFIFNQRKNIERGYYLDGAINERYLKCAGDTLDIICNLENISSIDIFNYDNIGIDKYDKKTNMINGNFNDPIFGIGSIFDYKDPRYRFTKTHRHVCAQMKKMMTQEIIHYENIVVYGHSLGEFDYNYFLSVLDKIDISNPSKNSCFVYVYSIYDETKRNKIEKTVRNRVYKLFDDYTKTRKLRNDLFDSLESQKRILMVELGELGEEYNYKSHFDDKEYEEDDL